MYKKLILGSPGTGKTTRLLSITEDKLLTTSPDKIAFFSFTKKAVTEAMERAAKKFSLAHAKLTHFKTLHALAYRALGLTNDRVFSYSHRKKLQEITGVKILGFNPMEDAKVEKGDTFLFLESYARSIKKNVYEVWQDTELDVSWTELKLFIDTYNKFKHHYNVIDYTDMLEQYLTKCAPLSIDIAIVDEAQDLSALQWDVVNKAVALAKEFYIAGDDDQAIYKWSGADVQQFLSLEVDEKEILPKSYRLPVSIFNFANDIVNKINTRYEKEWVPRENQGSVEFHNDISQIDFSGNWLILARSNYQLKQIETHFRDSTFLYTIKGEKSVVAGHIELILAYVALQKDKKISDTLWQQLKKYYSKEEAWYKTLSFIPFQDREYYRALLRQGVKLSADPILHINTIHGSKGGEADKVLIISDLSVRTYDNFMKYSDDEHRVFYVGVTRAREELHILKPQTGLYYEL